MTILEQAMRSLDRAEKCRRTIDKAGEIITDRFGQLKVHPLLTVERDNRAAFLSGLRQLNLDVSEGK